MSNDPVKIDGAIARKTSYGMLREPTFSGMLSFMRCPFRKDLTGVELVISGIPLDLAVSYRSGARFGPLAIRQASAEVASLKPYPWGFDPFENLAVIDSGDCFLDVHNPMTIHGAIIDHARHILASGARMLTFGGDHSISYPLLKAHVEKTGAPLSLIHFDAHCDTWPDDSPASLNHGSMFYKAVRDGLIDIRHSVQIGIRTWNDDFMGISILDADQVHRQGTDAVVAEIERIVGVQPAYLTFDIDCLDPAYAPGTGTPVCGGLSTAQVLAIIRGLTAINLIGMDIVEVSPPYDHGQITALAAAHIACDLICLLAKRKADGML
ncbi:agmatinase [Nitrosomonas sp. HPC101]|uniref:agmatinase n=1 Tax=Nitrosomonas sp. HPC101 TaxID=1658667 RepID=UPI00136ACBF4|nr:agmatinase [Nitrosomonas sp. HPC101]MXS84380.1 agmatinase [Nitrosomonas sp. HPC101]